MLARHTPESERAGAGATKPAKRENIGLTGTRDQSTNHEGHTAAKLVLQETIAGGAKHDADGIEGTPSTLPPSWKNVRPFVQIAIVHAALRPKDQVGKCFVFLSCLWVRQKTPGADVPKGWKCCDGSLDEDVVAKEHGAAIGQSGKDHNAPVMQEKEKDVLSLIIGIL